MAFSQEDINVILGSKDLSGQEDIMKRQYAMAQALRGAALPTAGRMDFGSQLARAASGIGGGYAEMQGQATAKDLGAQRLDLLKKLAGGSTPTPVIPSPQAAAQAAAQKQALDIDT